MRSFLLIIYLFFFSFCLNGQLITGTLFHDGLNRSYQIYLPSNIAPNAPLIFSMHGHTGNMNQQMNWTNFNALADIHGFAVCYPMGSLSNAGNPFWDSGLMIGTADDVGFLTSLALYLQQNYQLNPDETFACGFSNGGYMSYHLACQASSTFRAIATVGGLMTLETFNSCNPTNPVPVFHIHGDMDNIVPIIGYPDFNDGWGAGVSASDCIAYWNGINNTDPLINDSFLTSGGTTVLREVYPSCGSPNWFYTIVGEDHYWPNSGNALTDFEASEEIWAFFKQFTNQANCPVDFTYNAVVDDFLSGENISKQACNNIYAENILGTGANVIYDASNCVELQNGFEAKLGCSFTAKVGGCSY